MKATLIAIGAIGLLTTPSSDCSVRPPAKPPSGELYLVDANGDEWPVVELGEPGTQGIRNVKGKLYMPEWEWLVEFEVVGPGDGPAPGRYTGEKWQAYGPSVSSGPARYGGYFFTDDCTGEWVERLGVSLEEGQPACRPTQTDLGAWQPVAPGNFGHQIFDNGESLRAINPAELLSSGYYIGEWPNGELIVCFPVDLTSVLPPGAVVEECETVDVTPENWPGPPPSPYTIKFDRL